jgi:hypothetical protein
MPPRLLVVLKSLTQLGPVPLALLGAYRLGLRTGYFRRASARDVPRSVAGAQAGTIRALSALPSRESLLQVLGAQGRTALLAEANEIVAGQVRLFDGPPVPLRLSFGVPLQHWSVYESDPQQLVLFHDEIPDIKLIWEPARFGWAFTLGRAYHATQDERYAESFWTYFDEFCNGNPPYLGPHWMNGQEAAIRLMTMAWSAQVFSSSPHSSAERVQRLARTVQQHAARIQQTLIYSRSQNNNHLLTESAALFTAGSALQNSQWRKLGWRWLTWAFAHQIGDYGEYIQHSTNYHRLMLHIGLWVTAILNHTGDQWPATTAQALARAAHWLFSMLDSPSGKTPNLGANDGALLLPLSATSHADYRPTIQAAARAFLRTQLPPGPWDELSLWLGLDARRGTRQAEDYLTDNLRGKTSWAYLRSSQFKSRLQHMDQLHLDLWWRGLNIAQDAGTFSYNAAAPWDNPLVATRVHNTVTVDGREQMMRGGKFLTLDWFPAYSRTLIDHDDRVTKKVEAHHNGYRGVRHERRVSVQVDDSWRIVDRLTARAGHTYRLHWLLPDWDWKLECNERTATLRIESPFGPVVLRIKTDSGRAGGAVFSVVRAGELVYGHRDARPFEGWYSPIYGQKLPALSFACEMRADRNANFESEFGFPT